jgi:small nuclear ribonucleoprotein (snRNP)-like protein
MDWKFWDKKKIFVKLKTGECYNGYVTGVDSVLDNSGFITIIDKFDDVVSIAVSEIVRIVDENGGSGSGGSGGGSGGNNNLNSWKGEERDGR